MGRSLVVGDVTGQRKQRMINDDIVGLGSAWSSDKVSGLISGWNLLDNWYLVDPVNQRGRLEYDSAWYTIDRWLSLGDVLVKLTSNGVVIRRHPSRSAWFYQRLENPHMYLGRTYTMSVIADNKLYTSTFNFNVFNGVFGRLTTHFGFIQCGVSGPNFSFDVYVNIHDDVTLQAVKLELGTVSTLLNDPPPHPALELAKCQRFYETSYPHGVPPGTASARGMSYGIAIGSTRISPGYFKVTKRITPHVTIFGRGGGTNRVTEALGVVDFPNSVSTNSLNASPLNTGALFTTGLTPGLSYRFHWVADANL